MKNFLKTLGPMVVLAALLGGCRPPLEAELSPDGTRVVMATQQGLSLRRADGKGKASVVYKGDAQAPEWSPDGRYVVFSGTRREGRSQTLLLDMASGRARPLPVTLAPPYAWRGDGKEFVGFRYVHPNDVRAQAVMFRLSSRSVVGRYPVSTVPSRVLWIPGTRDLALAQDKGLELVQGGKARMVVREKNMMALGYQPGEHRVVWARYEAPGEDIDKATLDIEGYSLRTARRERLAPRLSARDLFPGSRRLFLPGHIEVSPRGDRLAMAGLKDVSPPEVTEEYLALERRLHGIREKGLGEDIDPADRRRERELESKIRLEAAVVVLDTASGRGSVLSRRPVPPHKDIGEMALFPVQVRWATGGQRLSVVFDRQVTVVPAPQR